MQSNSNLKIHLKDDADGGTAVMQAADYGRLDALKVGNYCEPHHRA